MRDSKKYSGSGCDRDSVTGWDGVPDSPLCADGGGLLRDPRPAGGEPKEAETCHRHRGGNVDRGCHYRQEREDWSERADRCSGKGAEHGWKKLLRPGWRGDHSEGKHNSGRVGDLEKPLHWRQRGTIIRNISGRDVMVACELPKLDARVRFPPPAIISYLYFSDAGAISLK